MREHAVVPSGVERTFRSDQIIVSKTDAKGLLTYVNELFVSISGYEEHELIGQPHNIIRHPEMPRGIFALLWERISGGDEIFAYVVNLSADGGHYWVLAHVTPTLDASGRVVGYHSNRRTASPAALAQVQPLYASLLAAERAETRTPDAVRASGELLRATLASLDLTYDEWVWSLDTEEVAA